jgi:GLPGLI family protein
MKSITLLLSIALVAINLNTFAGGKKPAGGFSGTVKYKITYEGREISAQEQAQMPSEIVEYHLNNMTRKDMVTPMYSVITILNNETQETILLIDAMGRKFYIKKSGEEVKAAMAKNDSANAKPEVKMLDGTKTIAGYVCKKAELVSGEETTTVFYTDAIAAVNQEYKEIPGYPMYYSSKIPQMEELVMVGEATSVDTKKPSKKLFEIPSDYEEMTPEMAKQMGM